MFTRIFVPLDGSPRAERALPVAARLAHASHGTVILASVISPALIYSPALAVPPNSPALIDDEVEGAKEYLARTQRGAVLTGIPTEAMVGIARPPSVELIDLAQSAHADIIVMCSHGRGGLMRWALGSVAQAIVRASPIPALVLKEGGQAPFGTPDASIQVLVPLDGSPLAETAIEPAVQLVAALSAPGTGTVTLLQVIRYPVLPFAPFQSIDPYFPEAEPGEREPLQAAAAAYLHDVAQRFTKAPLLELGVRVSTAVVFSEDVASAIAEAADGAEDVGESADMIVMATHGRMGFQRLALGSIAERVLQTTKRPLLVVPPLAKATAREPVATSVHTADKASEGMAANPLS